ncbi:uncharacterized protein LOC122251077 [Penaeus japonicus]|uniref:uncharacterized protein LOC122251077 n=1 Tax=Penaeus japonicus TaxID=27405 RepID=UPI001C713443|nr:uncharacterized protein LOC122251077 [Penaeus japonicus]
MNNYSRSFGSLLCSGMAPKFTFLFVLQVAALIIPVTISHNKPPLVYYMYTGNNLIEFMKNNSFTEVEDIPDNFTISFCLEPENPHFTVHEQINHEGFGHFCYNATQYTVSYDRVTKCWPSSRGKHMGESVYQKVMSGVYNPNWTIEESGTKCQTSVFVQHEKSPQSHIVEVNLNDTVYLNISFCTTGIIALADGWYMFNRKIGSKFVYLEEEGVNITYPLLRCARRSGIIEQIDLRQAIDEIPIAASNGETTQNASVHNISSIVDNMERIVSTTSTVLPMQDYVNELSYGLMTDPLVNAGTRSPKSSVCFVMLVFTAVQFGRPVL